MMSNYKGEMSIRKGDLSYRSVRKEKPSKIYKEITETPDKAFVMERVIDWNARIEGYSQEKKNKYAIAFQKL